MPHPATHTLHLTPCHPTLQLVLNYLATSFMVLDFWECLEVWASVHYIPVIIITVGSFVGPMLLRGGKKRSKGSKAVGGAAGGDAAVDKVKEIKEAKQE